MTTVTVGTPLAIVTVWALETFVTVHGHALQFDSTQACAIGSVGAGFIGYLMQVFQGLYSLIIERLTRP
jgi:hypothetical protein